MPRQHTKLRRESAEKWGLSNISNVFLPLIYPKGTGKCDVTNNMIVNEHN